MSAVEQRACLLASWGLSGSVAAVTVLAAKRATAISFGSDARLKHSICHVDTLENGIRLHAFKYLNDDQFFVGVLAQELLEDERFASAVTVGDEGYYRVNYAQLGLHVDNPIAMQAAGHAALDHVH